MQGPYLKELKLVEVDEMVEPSQRYMSMNINNDMIQELIDMYEEGGRIDRSAIARTVGRAMNLSDHCTTPTINRRQDLLNIRRFRFFLHVVETEADRNHPGKSFLVTGFTDEIGNEDLEDLNKHSLMYVNSIIELRSCLDKDRRGNRYERYSISKMMVVHRKDHRTRGHHNGRVTDVLTFCSLAEAGEIDIRDNADDDNTVASSTMFAKRQVRGASLSDMTRNNFLHRLISADKSGMADSRTYSDNEFDDDDEGQGTRRYNAAAGTYADTPEIDRGNSFIVWMRSRSQTMSNEMTFEYKDLIDMVDVRNPNFDDLCDNTDIIALCDNDDITYVSREFYGKSNKMRSIAIMTQEIPAMMSECLLSRVTFTIDNKHLDRDGRPEVSIDDYSTVVNIEGVDEMLDVFIRRYVDEVYLVATNDNDRYMNLHINCNFGGQVEIEMAYENEDFEEFRFPAFMSGILSNNTSFDRKETYRLANSYTSISKDFVERTVFGEEDKGGGVDRERLDKITKAFRD